MVARTYRRAISHNAVHFLAHVLNTTPLAITSLPVDGGNEFRNALEQACQAPIIALDMLPPKAPSSTATWNAPTALREEFYGLYRHPWHLQAVNQAPVAFQHHYYHHRPYGGKGRNFLTPKRIINTLRGITVISQPHSQNTTDTVGADDDSVEGLGHL